MRSLEKYKDPVMAETTIIPQNTLDLAPELPQPEALDPLGDGISSLALVRVSGSDVDIVNAARVSFGKVVTTLSPRDEKLIDYLVKHQHTSPFEHNQLSFRVKCPLFVQRQWMRHRMSSYNEISYRYVKSALEFYTPLTWRYQDTQNRQGSVGSFEDEGLKKIYLDGLAHAAQAYQTLLDQGVCRELARGLLPMSTYTEFIYTVNLHSLAHFIKLRTHPGAQYEIRQFAQGLLELATPHFPIALKAWKEYHLQHDEHAK
jgi:thymidylate synthase (FAD)